MTSIDPSLPTVLLAWTLDPAVLLALLLLALIYAAGIARLRQRGRFGRNVQTRHVTLFGLGWLALLLALQSPLDTYAADLFSLHMVQHLLLLMVAPPLLLLGKAVPVLLVGLPVDLARRLVRLARSSPVLHPLLSRLTAPLVAWPLYIGDLVLWHAPALYQAALEDQTIHKLEHLCFLSTGLLFWWVVVEPLPGPIRLHHGLRLIYTWAAVLPTTALGALFTFSGQLWYPVYALVPRLWGLSALDDQRFGGLIMWLPGDMMYVAASSLLFFAMLAADERTEGVEALP
ncbi:MAG TPA: cytochrome c oxidase assembly protein [Chloroflexota bacterium]|nr:cytochrome c oxidase assembly protein [Chloroflexota bacterium]